jgi:hypothetical protein
VLSFGGRKVCGCEEQHPAANQQNTGTVSPFYGVKYPSIGAVLEIFSAKQEWENETCEV